MSDAPYIENLSIQSYGCIRDADFALARLHAFVGPNDAGKSTILSAAARAIDPSPLDPRPLQAFPKAAITARWRGGWTSQRIGHNAPAHTSDNTVGQQPVPPNFCAAVLALDPRSMRNATALIPSDTPLRFLDAFGTGLAAVYDAIFGRNPDAFFEIRDAFLALFPSVVRLGWVNVSGGKQLEVVLRDGTRVPSTQMSEGMLYYLAFAALFHLEDIHLLCIEEPENGLHPARIREVVRVLRAVSARTQILLATHSPLVVNELQPDEVTVVTRSAERGTQGILLRDTANFAQRAAVYAPGELWLSYANGEDERPLIEGGPRP